MSVSMTNNLYFSLILFSNDLVVLAAAWPYCLVCLSALDILIVRLKNTYVRSLFFFVDMLMFQHSHLQVQNDQAYIFKTLFLVSRRMCLLFSLVFIVLKVSFNKAILVFILLFFIWSEDKAHIFECIKLVGDEISEWFFFTLWDGHAFVFLPVWLSLLIPETTSWILCSLPSESDSYVISWCSGLPFSPHQELTWSTGRSIISL